MIRGNYQPALCGNVLNASECEVPEGVTDKPETGTHRIDGPLRQDEFTGLRSPSRTFARNCRQVVQKIPNDWIEALRASIDRSDDGVPLIRNVFVPQVIVIPTLAGRAVKRLDSRRLPASSIPPVVWH